MDTNQIVVFGLNSQQYALPIKDVSEIMRMVNITKIPNARSFYKGIINLRNAIVPVISLCMRLGMEDNQLTSNSLIIVTEVDDKKTGLVVDSVHSVIRYSDEELEDPHSTGSTDNIIKGILHRDDQIILLLDPKIILEC